MSFFVIALLVVQCQAQAAVNATTAYVLAQSVVPACDNCGVTFPPTTLGRARNCASADTTDVQLSPREKGRGIWLRWFDWPSAPELPDGSTIIDFELTIEGRATGKVGFVDCFLTLSDTIKRAFPCNAVAVAVGAQTANRTLSARMALMNAVTVAQARSTLFGISFAVVSLEASGDVTVGLRCGLARLGFAQPSNSTSLIATTTTTAALTMPSTTTTPPTTVNKCPNLPSGSLALPAPVRCVADLDRWRFDCPMTVSLPNAMDPVASVGGVTFQLRRCPQPAFVLAFNFTVAVGDIPQAVKAALQSRKIDIPSGKQRAEFQKPLSTIQVELPVWPLSGIVDIAATAFTPAARIGVAIVIKNVELEAARAKVTIAVRACNGRPTCVDVPLGTLVFGNNDPCCLPTALQCPAEVIACTPTTQSPTTTAVVEKLTDAAGRDVTDANGVPVTVPLASTASGTAKASWLAVLAYSALA